MAAFLEKNTGSIFDTIEYIDFHTHTPKHSTTTSILEIVSHHLTTAVDITATYYTIGKHPWWTDSILSVAEKEMLMEYLQKPSCLALGEIGLDKYKGSALAQQKTIFCSQLDIAAELGMPVIIHCVRAYEELLQIKKKYPTIPNWCIHGYARKIGLAVELVKNGFYLSLMPRKKVDTNYIELVRGLPVDKFFLETDSMSEVEIEIIYLQVAAILECSVETLQEQLIKNVKTFFRK